MSSRITRVLLLLQLGVRENARVNICNLFSITSYLYLVIVLVTKFFRKMLLNDLQMPPLEKGQLKLTELSK